MNPFTFQRGEGVFVLLHGQGNGGTKNDYYVVRAQVVSSTGSKFGECVTVQPEGIHAVTGEPYRKLQLPVKKVSHNRESLVDYVTELLNKKIKRLQDEIEEHNKIIRSLQLK